MNRKRKYRYLILAFLALDLMLMGWLGYRIPGPEDSGSDPGGSREQPGGGQPS